MTTKQRTIVVSRAESGQSVAGLIHRHLSLSWSVARRLVADEHSQIADALWDLTEQADLVLTTGGTGFAPRDVTPEATAEVVERPTPGLDEAMREVSRRASPHGLLSRGRSGIVGRTLIVNFPGSPRACAECFDAVAAALPHGVELLTERPTEHP